MVLTLLRRKRIFKFILKVILLVIFILGVIYLFSNRFNLNSTWYLIDNYEVYKYEFIDNNTYTKRNLNFDNNSNGNYTYDKDKNKLLLEEETIVGGLIASITSEYNIKKSSGKKFEICEVKNTNNCMTLYKNKEDLEVKDLICGDKNKKGFCIENNNLVAYAGSDIEIEVPSNNIDTISSYSFNKYYSRGKFLKNVTVTGSIKTIENNAFAFSKIDNLYIEEGVEEIGDYAFNDTCLSIIDFPKSIKTIGKNIFMVDEICNNTIKIYLYKDSEVDKYLKKIKPYYNEYKFIYK